MSIAEELERLRQLRESGTISEEEFAEAKAKVLQDQAPPPAGESPVAGVSSGLDASQWAMLLHLSQFAGFVIPFAGLVAPILIWQLKKDTVPGLDAHGKEVLNWMICLLLYGIAAFVLSFFLIGIPILIALGIAAIVFPIIGGIKAKDGVHWRYPLTIRFLR